MYFPNKYDSHNEALKKLISVFNHKSEKYDLKTRMIFSEKENFYDDGGFSYNNKKLLFDFEKRHSYYKSYRKFKFDKLGQFERKIKKEKIKVSIQMSEDESAILFAWHDDFLDNPKKIKSKTQKGFESNEKRFTKDFIEIPMNQIYKLCFILEYAMHKNIYNKNSFFDFENFKISHNNQLTSLRKISDNDLKNISFNDTKSNAEKKIELRIRKINNIKINNKKNKKPKL